MLPVAYKGERSFWRVVLFRIWTPEVGTECEVEKADSALVSGCRCGMCVVLEAWVVRNVPICAPRQLSHHLHLKLQMRKVSALRLGV